MLTVVDIQQYNLKSPHLEKSEKKEKKNSYLEIIIDVIKIILQQQFKSPSQLS